MRGLGDFQRAQMKRSDPRVTEIFRHVRGVVDILERLALEWTPTTPPPEPSKPKLSLAVSPPNPTPPPPTTTATDHTKIAYSIKEVCQKIGVSRSFIYQAISD